MEMKFWYDKRIAEIDAEIKELKTSGMNPDVKEKLESLKKELKSLMSSKKSIEDNIKGVGLPVDPSILLQNQSQHGEETGLTGGRTRG